MKKKTATKPKRPNLEPELIRVKDDIDCGRNNVKYKSKGRCSSCYVKANT